MHERGEEEGGERTGDAFQCASVLFRDNYSNISNPKREIKPCLSNCWVKILGDASNVCENMAENVGNLMSTQEMCRKVNGNAGKSWKIIRISWNIAEQSASLETTQIPKHFRQFVER